MQNNICLPYLICENLYQVDDVGMALTLAEVLHLLPTTDMMIADDLDGICHACSLVCALTADGERTITKGRDFEIKVIMMEEGRVLKITKNIPDKRAPSTDTQSSINYTQTSARKH